MEALKERRAGPRSRNLESSEEPCGPLSGPPKVCRMTASLAIHSGFWDIILHTFGVQVSRLQTDRSPEAHATIGAWDHGTKRLRAEMHRKLSGAKGQEVFRKMAEARDLIFLSIKELGLKDYTCIYISWIFGPYVLNI